MHNRLMVIPLPQWTIHCLFMQQNVPIQSDHHAQKTHAVFRRSQSLVQLTVYVGPKPPHYHKQVSSLISLPSPRIPDPRIQNTRCEIETHEDSPPGLASVIPYFVLLLSGSSSNGSVLHNYPQIPAVVACLFYVTRHDYFCTSYINRSLVLQPILIYFEENSNLCPLSISCP